PAAPPPVTCPPSLHDALPIFDRGQALARVEAHDAELDPGLPGDLLAELDHVDEARALGHAELADGDLLLAEVAGEIGRAQHAVGDRKSTRLNSSHVKISYAGF